ncbi:pyruvate kinase [Holophaga foetida]|uniref:pyruvate kinase n=1 Tax=Holophaga foetida TaxID=35839 RepID=UPI00024749BA|nr:pyruvate kinase [Holophaga foetida]
MRKTKLVTTVGPALLNGGPLREVLEITDAIRINASHSTPQDRTAVLDLVRRTAEEVGRRIPVFLDLQGPKWRIGILDNPLELELGTLGVFFREGQSVPSGFSWAAPLPHPELMEGARPGQKWLLDDGNLSVEIQECRGDHLIGRVLVGGALKSRKGIHPLGIDVAIEPLTSKDIEDVKWGVEQGVDLFAQSFVRSGADIQALTATIRAFGGSQFIIAKIEHPKALDNLDEILAAAWGVMVARGDLGVELGVEKVPHVQKHIIRQARLAMKPIITATQMLESMIESPQPTRAESSDIANAIWDGTDAVMLSAESAAGKFPLEAVQWLARIAEDADDHAEPHTERRVDRLSDGMLLQTDAAVAFAACRAAEDLNAKALLVFTEKGGSVRLVSRLAGSVPVFGATTNEHNARLMGLLRGVQSLIVPRTQHLSEMVASVEPLLKERCGIQPGDKVVMTVGHPLWTAGSTNTMRVTTF